MSMMAGIANSWWVQLCLKEGGYPDMSLTCDELSAARSAKPANLQRKGPAGSLLPGPISGLVE